MFVIEVIPLLKGTSSSTFTYYSKTPYPLGTLLKIPVRSRDIGGVVVDIKPVSIAKTALKSATFSLRKLPESTHPTTLPTSLTQTAQALSEIYPASIGALLFALLPPQIRDGVRPYPDTQSYQGDADPTPQVLTDTTDNRYITYKSSIRETFAHRGSVLFVVPTAADILPAKRKLEKGIEQRIVTFFGAQTKKERDAAFESFGDLRTSKVIITTPAYAFLDRHDITHIILEHSASVYYKSRERPYLDYKEALMLYARVTRRTILIGDTLPHTSDEHKRREDIYLTHHEHSKRLDCTGTLVCSIHPPKESGEEFSITTLETREALTRIGQQKGHAFIYAARKGLSTLVTCYDCGHVLRCPQSGAPYALMRTYKGDVEERWLVCGTSGSRVRAEHVCLQCGSWRLREQGIGVQQVYDHVRELCPTTDIYLFDHTTATTHKKARSIIDSFYGGKAGILIGTAMTLPYLTHNIDLGVISSYEALRANPTWRADEVILATLMTMREITTKDVIVQLRSPEDEILKFAARGTIDQFYDSEIDIRKSLSYPPFVRFALLSCTGTKEHIDATTTLIRNLLPEHTIEVYNAPVAPAGMQLRYHLIRSSLRPGEHAALCTKLTTLPPYIKIEIDPDRIV
jgi:primosomal protein N'